MFELKRGQAMSVMCSVSEAGSGVGTTAMRHTAGDDCRRLRAGAVTNTKHKTQNTKHKTQNQTQKFSHVSARACWTPGERFETEK